jgi:2'-5' RNA ligase
MTVLRVGPTSAISASKMGAVAQRLAAELQGWGPVEVAIGPAWVWGGNVCAHLTPEEPLKDLYEVCSTAFLGLIPAAPKASFLPHVTLAYGRDYTQENELRRTLHSHWIEPVAVVLPSLPLVRERQTPPCYSWEVEAVLPIGISVAAGSRSR